MIKLATETMRLSSAAPPAPFAAARSTPTASAVVTTSATIARKGARRISETVSARIEEAVRSLKSLRSYQADLAAGVTFEPPSKLELEQHRLHRGGRQLRLADQLVDLDSGGAEQVEYRPPRRFVGLGRRAGRGIIELALAERADAKRADRLEHVLGALDQGRAFADQMVAALGARVERRAGHRHHLTAELGGVARRDQRAGFGRRLDHDRAMGEAGDDPVAIGEVTRTRLEAGRLLGDEHAAFGDRRLPLLVLRRIGDVDAARDHRG